MKFDESVSCENLVSSLEKALERNERRLQKLEDSKQNQTSGLEETTKKIVHLTQSTLHKENYKWILYTSQKNTQLHHKLTADELERNKSDLIIQRDRLQKDLVESFEKRKNLDRNLASISGNRLVCFDNRIPVQNDEKNIDILQTMKSQADKMNLIEAKTDFAKLTSELETLKLDKEETQKSIESTEIMSNWLKSTRNELENKFIHSEDLLGDLEKQTGDQNMIINNEQAKIERNCQEIDSKRFELLEIGNKRKQISQQLAELDKCINETRQNNQSISHQTENNEALIQFQSERLNELRTILSDSLRICDNLKMKQESKSSMVKILSNEVKLAKERNNMIKNTSDKLKSNMEIIKGIKYNLSENRDDLDRTFKLLPNIQTILDEISDLKSRLEVESSTFKSNEMRLDTYVKKHDELMSCVLMLQRKIRILNHTRIESQRNNQRHALEVAKIKQNILEEERKLNLKIKLCNEESVKTIKKKKIELIKGSTDYELVRAVKNVIASRLQVSNRINDKLEKCIGDNRHQLKIDEILLEARLIEMQKEQVQRFQTENSCRNLKHKLNIINIRLNEALKRKDAIRLENLNLDRCLNLGRKELSDNKESNRILGNQSKQNGEIFDKLNRKSQNLENILKNNYKLDGKMNEGFDQLDISINKYSKLKSDLKNKLDLVRNRNYKTEKSNKNCIEIQKMRQIENKTIEDSILKREDKVELTSIPIRLVGEHSKKFEWKTIEKKLNIQVIKSLDLVENDHINVIISERCIKDDLKRMTKKIEKKLALKDQYGTKNWLLRKNIKSNNLLKALTAENRMLKKEILNLSARITSLKSERKFGSNKKKYEMKVMC